MESLLIEYALFSTDIDYDSIERYTNEANAKEISNLLIPPYWVKKAARDLRESKVKITCLTGYPYGYQLVETKLFEAENAINMGAEDIALAINISVVKSTAYEWVKIEIARFAHFMHDQEKMLGVYLPTSYITLPEMEILCKLCLEAGADYLVIPFAPYGSTGITMIKKVIGENIGLKVWCHTEEELAQIEVVEQHIDAVIISKL